jgi:hypothetical protein
VKPHYKWSWALNKRIQIGWRLNGLSVKGDGFYRLLLSSITVGGIESAGYLSKPH